MIRLPPRPSLFILAYISSFSVILIPGLLGSNVRINLVPFAVSLALGLQLWWTHQAITFVWKITRDHETGTLRAIAGYIFLMIGFCAVYVAVYPSYVESRLTGTILESYLGVTSPILGLAVVLLFVAIFWIAAHVICEAEGREKLPAHSVVGTFLLFFYLVVGVPWIYGRLKRLAGRTDSLDMRAT